MMIEVDVTCPECGTVNRRREQVVALTTAVTVAPKEVVWCRECGAEIPPTAGGVPARQEPS